MAALPMLSIGQHRISGFVRDSLSREVLVGAHIIDSVSLQVAVTNNSGHFSINLKNKGKVTVSFVGYEPKEIFLHNTHEQHFEVLLNPALTIDEVVVTHTRRHTQNVATLSNLEFQQLPSLGAKPDVIKAIQLLPGIKPQNEGTSTILVRGGNPGENLYLFDDVALIYVNHLGGFASVFNPDIINSISVYKGGFPAKYGGKLSSIMDMVQREGNANRLQGAYSIGVTDASFVLEGPTPLKNSTFIATGRKTLIDPVLALASAISGGGDYILSYGFHDINSKFTWRPDTKNTLNVNFYQGDDYINYWYWDINRTGSERARLTNVWGNWLLSARWAREHNSWLHSTQNLSLVRYRLKNRQSFTSTKPHNEIKFFRDYRSIVQDLSYKWDFKANPFRNIGFDFGAQASYLRYNPNKIKTSSHSAMQSEPTLHAFEPAVYAEAKLQVSRVLVLRLGGRGVGFLTSEKMHYSLEPRGNLDIHLGKNQTLNASYMQTKQFAHLLYTQGEIMSNEVWVPAAMGIEPATTQQVSAGWHGSFGKGMWDIEINAYHKTLQNIATYREGYTSVMGDGNWRDKVMTGGKGESYGAEFLLKKTRGIWTGFLGYTWSKSFRQYPHLNHGKPYTFEYDRPHDITLSVSRKLGSKWSVSSAWVFQSGLPFTPVIGRQYIPDILGFMPDDELFYYEAFIYGERNSMRMRNYHRLDLAFHYNTKTKYGNSAQWTFAIYNAYNRKNPYTYMFTHDLEKGGYGIPHPGWDIDQSFSLYQISMFPILPTISYKVTFDDVKGYRALRSKIRKEKKSKRSSWLYFDE